MFSREKKVWIPWKFRLRLSLASENNEKSSQRRRNCYTISYSGRSNHPTSRCTFIWESHGGNIDVESAKVYYDLYCRRWLRAVAQWECHVGLELELRYWRWQANVATKHCIYMYDACTINRIQTFDHSNSSKAKDYFGSVPPAIMGIAMSSVELAQGQL